MPDLQSEIFTKVLPSLNNLKFDDDAEIDMPQVEFVKEEKEPLVRRVFAYIRDNKKVRGKDVMDVFTSEGHSRAVVASTISALIKDDRAVRVGGKLSTTRDTYEKPKVAKATAKPAQAVHNAKQDEPKPTFDIDVLLGTLSMYQGRELYTRLKAIYGG